MKKMFIVCLAFAASLFSIDAFCEQGEYWEQTVKMEMKGMPFAMPAQTKKVCEPLVEKDLATSLKEQKSNCELLEHKKTGKKFSYKMKCIENGETMYSEGEGTKDKDSSHGATRTTGKNKGRDMEMTMITDGKRIGGSCDPDEERRKLEAENSKRNKEAHDQMCDSSGFNSRAWIEKAYLFLPSRGKAPACPGKKEMVCDAARKDATRDATTYNVLVREEKNREGSIAANCGLNMEAITRDLCKTINDSNYSQLLSYCPAEAKAMCKTLNEKNYPILSADCPAEAKIYLAAKRKKDCEGRDYTAPGDLSKCMSGKEESDTVEEAAPTGKKKKPSDIANKKTGEEVMSKGEEDKSKSNNPAQSVIDSAKSINGESMIDGAKKLKGMFGF